MMTEQEYDATWAPRILAFAKELRDAGSSVVITADYEMHDGTRSTGSTIQTAPTEELHFHVHLMAILARAGTNIDAFMQAVERIAQKDGHDSVVLHLMGVPEKPAAEVEPGPASPPPAGPGQFS